MKHVLRKVSANAQQLADDRASPEAVRDMAAHVRDLSTLMETWPVPVSLNLGEELEHQLLRLCRQSGVALCGMRSCPTTSDVSCRVLSLEAACVSSAGIGLRGDAQRSQPLG